MTMYSYFETYTPPKPMKRRRKRFNELDPKDKGKTGYQDHYGINQ